MKSFIDWLLTDGFHIKSTWDRKTKKWVGAGKLVVFPIHEQVLGHALTPNADGEMPYETIVYSTPKKSGKSVYGAAILAWVLENYPPGTEIYSLANDLEQAEGIIFQDLAYHILQKYNIVAKKNRIDMPNGSFVQALSHHYRSAAGSRHSVTIFDELWGFNTPKSRRLWAEMTPIPTVNNSLRIVVTYAGFSQDQSPLRDLYVRLVQKGKPVLPHVTNSVGDPICFVEEASKTFCMWATDPIMPWQTPQYYASQSVSLRPEEYLRLHRNQWVSSQEMFIPPEWWDAASGVLQGPVDLVKSEFRDRPIIIAVDAGLKKDCTAVIGMYFNPENGHVGLAFHRIWRPLPGEILDLEETVERYILEKVKQFNILEVIYDPHQLQRSMMTLKKAGINVTEFKNTAEEMSLVTNTLYDLFKNGMIDLYEAADLKSHVINAIVKHTDKGMQFSKARGVQSLAEPTDGAVALAIAAHRTLHRGVLLPSEDIQMEIPFGEEDPFEFWEREKLRKIPEPLRPRGFEDENWVDYYGW